MEDREVLATVALSLVPGVGSLRLRTLIATFGSAEATLAAPESKLAAVFGIGAATARAIKESSIRDGARVCAQLTQGAGHRERSAGRTPAVRPSPTKMRAMSPSLSRRFVAERRGFSSLRGFSPRLGFDAAPTTPLSMLSSHKRDMPAHIPTYFSRALGSACAGSLK